MKTYRVAFLAGCGVGPELTAEASRTLARVGRVHGFTVDELHVPFGTEAVMASGALVPPSTRSAVLGADAVLIASRRGQALGVLEQELDLRATAVRVRHGNGDLIVVYPADDAAREWTAERAFAAARRRRAKIAVVGDAPGDGGLDVERPGLADALRALVLDPGRFDVVLGDPRTGPSLAAAAAGTGVVATGLLASHGPSVFAASHGRAGEIAGQGVANPSSLLLAASLMLCEGLGEPSAAETLARAVTAALGNGQRTPDLVSSGVGATTREFTDVVLELFQVVTPTAEFAA
jgi:3-isopropylmalate dehydrogenase